MISLERLLSNKEIEVLENNTDSDVTIKEVTDDGCEIYTIKRCGNTLYMNAFVGNKQLSSQTKCHPDDTFDLRRGIEIVFNRLIDKKYATEHNFYPHLEYIESLVKRNNYPQILCPIGKLTDIVDTRGEHLYTGDIVEVYWLRQPFDKAYNLPLCFVCEENGNSFISGYKDLTIGQFINGFFNDRVGRKAYSVRRIKRFEKLKLNETHDIVVAKTVNL